MFPNVDFNFLPGGLQFCIDGGCDIMLSWCMCFFSLIGLFIIAKLYKWTAKLKKW